MKEIWKDIAGYEGLYQVSNLGRVKSFERRWRTGKNNNIKRKHKEMIISKSKQIKSYHVVTLYKNNIQTQKGVHRLVAKAFIPNPENKPQVNHKDGNKLNNHINNLEWVTIKENMRHAAINGLKAKGEKNGNSKLTRKDVIEIKKMLKKGILQREIAEIYNVDRTAISLIKRNRNWKHVRIE